jgi:hypothetical protein
MSRSAQAPAPPGEIIPESGATAGEIITEIGERHHPDGRLHPESACSRPCSRPIARLMMRSAS